MALMGSELPSSFFDGAQHHQLQSYRTASGSSVRTATGSDVTSFMQQQHHHHLLHQQQQQQSAASISMSMQQPSREDRAVSPMLAYGELPSMFFQNSSARPVVGRAPSAAASSSIGPSGIASQHMMSVDSNDALLSGVGGHMGATAMHPPSPGGPSRGMSKLSSSASSSASASASRSNNALSSSADEFVPSYRNRSSSAPIPMSMLPGFSFGADSSSDHTLLAPHDDGFYISASVVGQVSGRTRGRASGSEPPPCSVFDSYGIEHHDDYSSSSSVGGFSTTQYRQQSAMQYGGGQAAGDFGSIGVDVASAADGNNGYGLRGMSAFGSSSAQDAAAMMMRRNGSAMQQSAHSQSYSSFEGSGSFFNGK